MDPLFKMFRMQLFSKVLYIGMLMLFIEIYYTLKTLFCFWATFFWTLVQQLTKLFQCCFLNVETTPINIAWLNFHLQLTINVEATLGHRHWMDVILSMLFQRCFVNMETTSINIRRLNFHAQPNFNVETTLVHWHWIDAILSTLFQRCFANVETTSKNVRRLIFYFQSNTNIETRLMNVDDQRSFNIDSTLMCLLGMSCMPKLLPLSYLWFSHLFQFVLHLLA